MTELYCISKDSVCWYRSPIACPECVLRDFTLQVEHQQLSAGVLIGPVAEGQHGFLQEVGGDDLITVVVVELPELPGDALFYCKPLSGRVTVEQKHLQKP